MRIYWVSHERHDGDIYSFHATYPTEEERDYHLEVLLFDDEARNLRFGDYERKES